MPRHTKKTVRAIDSDTLVTRLLALAENLAWSWHEPAQRPFAMLDPVAWEATNHAPIDTVLMTPQARIEAASSDPVYLATLVEAERTLDAARRAKRWFATTHRGRDRRLKVAYYCSEFAIHESMQQYSGGLGVLAGDHVKSAEDLGVPMHTAASAMQIFHAGRTKYPDGDNWICTRVIEEIIGAELHREAAK